MVKKLPNPIDKHVGSRLRMRRKMLGMSQEKLGEALKITFQQVQKYEKGTNRISASRLQHISHILQVPVPFFFEGAPHQPGQPRGVGGPASPAYVSEFLSSTDGLALRIPVVDRRPGAGQGVHQDQGGQAAPARGAAGRGDRGRRGVVIGRRARPEHSR